MGITASAAARTVQGHPHVLVFCGHEAFSKTGIFA